MGGVANAITLQDTVTNEEVRQFPNVGITPMWKKYTFMFGDSYSTGGESITTIIADTDFPHGILATIVEPTIVSSANVGPYLVKLDAANMKLLLYSIDADGVITELTGNTDVYEDATENLKVTVTVFGY